MLHHDAAARAERLALAMVGLRQPGRGSVGGDTRAGRRVAHGEPADLRGGRHVGLHQRRRHVEDACDVVEPFRRIVAGQQRLGVDGEVHQIAKRRCRTPPGSDDAARARPDRAPTRQLVQDALDVARPAGRAWPGRGGVRRPGASCRARRFRTAFSQVTAAAPACSTVLPTRRQPPARARSLWQVAQYCSTTPCAAAGTGCGSAPARGFVSWHAE